MILYIIRHAQSENNALWHRNQSYEGRQPDPELTEIGEKQAQLLAKFLAYINPGLKPYGKDSLNHGGFGITHLYTSLMRRSIATAVPVANALELPLFGWIDIHERLGMVDFDLENDEAIGLPGPNRSYFEENYPNLILPESLGSDGWWDKEAETLDEAAVRGRLVVKEVMDRHGGSEDRVAMITHGGFYQNIMGAILDYDGLHKGSEEAINVWFSFNNVAITRVNFEPDHILVVYANRVDFLPAELVT